MSKDELLKTRSGRQLYGHLPEVYRTRDSGDIDGTGDLARFLDACGRLLDLIRHTLDQRLADSFPDDPVAGLACQPWLLPYLADLLDVRLVSPDEAGRRDEVADAVAWRQRKGTLKALEQIAEKVGRFEVEVQEGWKRVATTPRIGLPLLPATALGKSDLFDDFQNHPGWAARHPALPAVMVDLRCPSRAMQVASAAGIPPQNPAAKQSTFAGQVVWWRQVNLQGVPCFPGSFEDVSRRTPDVHTPNWQQGHFHPKRVILYAPPSDGFFPLPQAPLAISPDPARGTFAYQPCKPESTSYCAEFPLSVPIAQVSAGSRGLLQVQTGTGETMMLPVAVTAVSDQTLNLKGPAPPEDLIFPVPSERVTLLVQNVLTIRWDRREETRFQGLFEELLEDRPGMSTPVRVFRNRTLGTEWFLPIKILGRIDLAEEEMYRFEGLHLDNTLRVDRGRLELTDAAARRVEIGASETEVPVLNAKDSLIRNLLAPGGLVRLEYCTILEDAVLAALQASDSIFLGILRQSGGLAYQPPKPACLRYSRYHERQKIKGMSLFRSTSDPAVMWTTELGSTGCGVLHPATVDSVRFGAEDGGEMGAYHGRQYSLLEAAVQEKLKEFLPVGIETVIVPDLRLQQLPREDCQTESSRNEP